MKNLSNEIREKIAFLTNWNNHSEARILLAKELGFLEFATQFKLNADSYEETEKLSCKLFAVVFLEDSTLKKLF